MQDNTGYINIVAVMQKFFDKGISGNWSYEYENYENGEVCISHGKRFAQHIQIWLENILCQNTMDGKTEDVIEELLNAVDDAANVMSGYEDDEDCEACAI